ncbi:aspartyl beta-hydroxylase [Ahniella affigens]|uniref:Aspartyl beta-hydroxylase n=1 Tax=Ahniella affigens TaxID=2021234 RepID=A0A2P1PWV1_9GAMM|nr:aspartyl/asparaginyl beta-hydroxylase domain-containing protein [Ahniella affigens]AVP99312.1 aspartyl beta-hydroxylase [Ahniella affigens]
MNLADLIQAAREAARRGQIDDAIEHYQEAAELAPEDGNLRRNIGVLLLKQGDLDSAIDQLELAAELSPEVPAIRLQLGRAYESRGDRQLAVRHYFRALVKAQLREQWLDQASTPPALWPLVQHAAAVAGPGRQEILMGLLEPEIAQYGQSAMARVARALHGYLGQQPAYPASANQRPRFLYFPGLREQHYYPPKDFAWVSGLEAAAPAIRAEALAQWHAGEDLQPFLEFNDPSEAGNYLGKAPGAAWNALFFYRGGTRFHRNHDACPQTSAALAACDLVHIGGHAPEVCFSILAPGTHILPHTGVTNIRLVVHLPLLIPKDCALSVAGERHTWEPDQVMVFDDTFEHEAWNKSPDTRIILLMDTWHPDLRPEERLAMTRIIEGIGQFHRGD